MKILLVDTCYPDFLASCPINPAGTYESELQAVLKRGFGTADFYSRNLRALGWDAIDVIANHDDLQFLWANAHYSGRERQPILDLQVELTQPDVVFMQDLSVPALRTKPPLLAGQCSCPWPGDDAVKRFDVLFTSFPHYLKRFESLGVKGVYLPLAFEPSVLDGLPAYTERPHDVVFIGGVGNPSHWRYGMQALEHVARIPTFKWWGYGVETLPADSPLRAKYQGRPAWGLEMYQILLQSKIVLNRHGEVALGWANNLRMFEATGCGALLLTEEARNLSDFFNEDEAIPYSTPHEAVEAIQYYLRDSVGRVSVAANGRARTLKDHTYAERMKVVSDTLKAVACPA